jgi:hypothetical protein
MWQSGPFMQRHARRRRFVRILTLKGGTSMLKISTIAACALALSGGVVLAQTMPPGPNAAPGGAGGSAPASSIGSPSANVQDNMGGGTRSTTVLSQSNKNQSAAGMSSSDYSSGAQLQYGTQPQQAQGMMGSPDNPRGVAITDEYGNQYNSRGDKIGRGRPARMR